jgi:hypothetical protein
MALNTKFPTDPSNLEAGRATSDAVGHEQTSADRSRPIWLDVSEAKLEDAQTRMTVQLNWSTLQLCLASRVLLSSR